MAALPDTYTLQARLYPALLVVLPVGFAIIAWFPDRFTGWGLLLSITTSCGCSVLLAQLGRDAGKRKEAWLFEQWGGPPTTQLLRHRDTRIDIHTKTRYHEKLQILLPNIPAPSKRKESANPDAADEVYVSWVRYLLENARDTNRFPLILKENISYGFRRNLWGWKLLGIALTLTSIILGISAATFAWGEASLPASAIIATVLDVCLLLFWIFLATPNWIRIAAFAYAERLLAACDSLQSPTPNPPSPPTPKA